MRENTCYQLEAVLMADVIPAFKISGTQAIIVALYVFVIFGTGHLLALSFPQSKAAKWWLSLGF